MTYVKFYVRPFVRYSRTANIVEDSGVSYLFKTTLLQNLPVSLALILKQSPSEILRFK